MFQLPMIRSVNQSISIDTKNHAMPSVKTASGNVSSLRIGFRIVFSTPKTSAAHTSVQPEPSFVTPLRIQVVRPSTTTFAIHETSSHRTMRGSWSGPEDQESSQRDD